MLPYLANGLLRFSPPGALNDPFEIRGFRDNIDAKAVHDHVMTQKFAKARKASNPRAFLLEFAARTSFLADQAIDPDAANARNWKRRFDRMDQTHGILSLTPRVDSSAMWSHYANRHRGVAIGFDFAKIADFSCSTKGFRRVQDITYTEELSELSFSDGLVKGATNVFFRKSKDWEYEDEWRIVANFEHASRSLVVNTHRKDSYGLPIRLVRFDQGFIREILLGVNAERETVEFVRRFAEKSKRHIPILQMKPSTTKYTLVREPFL